MAVIVVDMEDVDDVSEEEDMSIAELQETVKQQRELIELQKDCARNKDDEWAYLVEQKNDEIARLRERVSKMQFDMAMQCNSCKGKCFCEQIASLQEALITARKPLKMREFCVPVPTKRAASSAYTGMSAPTAEDLSQHFKRLRIDGGVTASA